MMVKRDEEMNDTVLIDNNDTWVKITLNRPDRLNSLNVDLHLALRAALDAGRQSRAVLITGAGRGFALGRILANATLIVATGRQILVRCCAIISIL